MNSPSVKIIETQGFIDSCSDFLSEQEVDAIRHLLAAKPASGVPMHEDAPQLLSLPWRNGEIQVIYLLSHDLDEIYLVVVTKTDPGDGGPGNGSSGNSPTAGEKVLKTLKNLGKIGIGASIKEIIDGIKGE